MSRVRMVRWVLACLALSNVVVAKDLDPAQQVERPSFLKPSSAGVGEWVSDLEFTDAEGVRGKLSEFADRRAVVLLASLPGCPIGQKFVPTVRALEKRYGKHVAFLYVNVGKDDAELVGAYRKKFAITTRFLLDKEQRLARHLQLKSSTEVVVLDRQRTLVYRGPIDDQYGINYSLPAPTVHYLVDALEEVLADKPVTVSALSAPGCVVDVEGAPAKPAITYHNRISRIVQHRCEMCHRENGIGPMQLAGFDVLNASASMVARVVKSKRMPPWPAAGDHIANDISLSEREREDLLQWIAQKPRVEGEKSDAPVNYRWPETWLIGKPDAIFTTDAYDVPDSGEVDYQYFELKTDFAEDRYVQDMEIRSKEPSVVHHVLVFVNTTIEEVKKGAGLQGFFMGMVPGQTTTRFPGGLYKTLPKGAKLVFQVHYTPTGIAARDQTQLGFRFAKTKPAIEVATNAAFSTEIDIAPHAKGVKVSGKFPFKKPTRLVAFSPHMHARGVAFSYELQYPDGKKKEVLSVPRFDFNWQFTFWLRTPIDVPEGTVLVATGEYDNSTNRNGMDPTKRVRFGEQTTDEMMIGYFFGYPLQ